jgi:hypothetical protein
MVQPNRQIRTDILSEIKENLEKLDVSNMLKYFEVSKMPSSREFKIIFDNIRSLQDLKDPTNPTVKSNSKTALNTIKQMFMDEIYDNFGKLNENDKNIFLESIIIKDPQELHIKFLEKNIMKYAPYNNNDILSINIIMDNLRGLQEVKENDPIIIQAKKIVKDEILQTIDNLTNSDKPGIKQFFEEHLSEKKLEDCIKQGNIKTLPPKEEHALKHSKFQKEIKATQKYIPTTPKLPHPLLEKNFQSKTLEDSTKPLLEGLKKHQPQPQQKKSLKTSLIGLRNSLSISVGRIFNIHTKEKGSKGNGIS